MAPQVDLARLCVAIQRARLMLRKYRAERTEMTRHFVGQHYSEHGTAVKVPVNFLALYVDIVGSSLISKEPRCLLSSFDRASKPILEAAQDWVNPEIQRKQVATTLQRVICDSLFSIGICKVALATPTDSATMAWSLRAGEPFAERVDLDDFVYDVHARDFNEVSYIGHRFRAPLDAVRDSPIYSRLRKQLAATYDELYNPEWDEKVSTIGRGLYGGNQEEFEDFTTLWEIYLPRHRLVLTLADDHLTGASLLGHSLLGEPLRVQRWLGPDTGPYHLLGLQTVPGNAMPKAPLQDLFDLAEFGNETFRKLMRQTGRLKEILGVAGQAMEDAARVNAASDGEAVQINRPDLLKSAVYGGPQQGVMAAFQVAWQYFNILAGNLEMQGGLSPQSKTLGQDELLAANASRLINTKQQQALKFTAEVLKGLVWYWWHDPLRVMSTRFNLPGMPEISAMRHVHPQQRRQIPFDQIDVKVDPYSITHQTPQQRLTALNGVIQLVMPMMPLLQQQGISLDFNAYLQLVSKYIDLPELPDIFTIQEPPEQESQTSASTGSMQPPETTRNYVRRSVGGATRYGQDIGRLNAMGPSSNGVSEPATPGEGIG